MHCMELYLRYGWISAKNARFQTKNQLLFFSLLSPILLLLTLNSIQNAKLCMTPFTISTSQVKIPHKKMLCVISTWRLTTSALDAKAIDKHHGKMVRRLLRSDYNYVIRCKNTRYKYME